MSKTILFIHGAWLTANSWDTCRSYFEARGYNTLAPAWPYKDASLPKVWSLLVKIVFM